MVKKRIVNVLLDNPRMLETLIIIIFKRFLTATLDYLLNFLEVLWDLNTIPAVRILTRFDDPYVHIDSFDDASLVIAAELSE